MAEIENSFYRAKCSKHDYFLLIFLFPGKKAEFPQIPQSMFFERNAVRFQTHICSPLFLYSTTPKACADHKRRNTYVHKRIGMKDLYALRVHASVHTTRAGIFLSRKTHASLNFNYIQTPLFIPIAYTFPTWCIQHVYTPFSHNTHASFHFRYAQTPLFILISHTHDLPAQRPD